MNNISYWQYDLLTLVMLHTYVSTLWHPSLCIRFFLLYSIYLRPWRSTDLTLLSYSTSECVEIQWQWPVTELYVCERIRRPDSLILPYICMQATGRYICLEIERRKHPILLYICVEIQPGPCYPGLKLRGDSAIGHSYPPLHLTACRSSDRPLLSYCTSAWRPGDRTLLSPLTSTRRPGDRALSSQLYISKHGDPAILHYVLCVDQMINHCNPTLHMCVEPVTNLCHPTLHMCKNTVTSPCHPTLNLYVGPMTGPTILHNICLRTQWLVTVILQNICV